MCIYRNASYVYIYVCMYLNIFSCTHLHQWIAWNINECSQNQATKVAAKCLSVKITCSFQNLLKPPCWDSFSISKRTLSWGVFSLRGYHKWLVNLTPLTYRNKGLIASLIQGNQWLVSLDHKAIFLGWVFVRGGRLTNHDLGMVSQSCIGFIQRLKDSDFSNLDFNHVPRVVFFRCCLFPFPSNGWCFQFGPNGQLIRGKKNVVHETISENANRSTLQICLNTLRQTNMSLEHDPFLDICPIEPGDYSIVIWNVYFDSIPIFPRDIFPTWMTWMSQ